MKNFFSRFNTISKFFLIICIFAGCIGCTQKTRYQSVDKTELSSFFSVQDQQTLVNSISDKFISSNLLKSLINNKKPTLLIDSINNKTSEHIDTESMTDTLKSNIIVSNKFKIINRNKLNLLAKEQELNAVGLTDSNKATQLGKLYGAQYVLYGNFSSIVNYIGKSKNTFYKLTMFLQNIETGEEVWVGEASINKVTK